MTITCFCTHTHRRRVFNMVHRLLGVSILIHGGERVSVELIFFDEWNQVLWTPSCFLSLCAAVALFLGSYLFHSPMIYWIVAALSLTIVIDLCAILLLECITRSHTGKGEAEVGSPCLPSILSYTSPLHSPLHISPPFSLTHLPSILSYTSPLHSLLHISPPFSPTHLPSILSYTSPLHSLLHVSSPFPPTRLPSILPYMSPLHSPLHISPPFSPTYLHSILPYISSLSSTCFIASCTHLCSQFLPL